MYIGRLNERIPGLVFSCYRKDSLEKESKCEEYGNPFLGERIHYKWKHLSGNGIDIHVTLPEEYFINNVVVSLGAKCKPTSVSLFDHDKENLIFCYSAETGKEICEKKLMLSAERTLSEFVIEINTDFSSVIVEGIDLFGAEFEEEMIYPTPVSITSGEGVALLSSFSSFRCDCDEGQDAGEIFAEKLSEKHGVHLQKSDDGAICFEFDDAIEKNGYRVLVTPEKIKVSASDKRGFVIGAETLLKLVKEGTIPCCEINDKPFCEFRGIHIFIPAEEQMSFAKSLVRDLLSPLGYNFIIMQLSGAMQYESHPEINDAFLRVQENVKAGKWPEFPHSGIGGNKIVSKDSVRDFLEFTRRFGIDVIPEIQCLSHVQYLTITYPEIAEREEPGSEYTVEDERDADVPPSSFYSHSFCPSNPKSYEIVFDLIDEVVELFQPKEYIHMGHDELYQVGLCPKCREKKPADILAEDINRIHDYLANKGLKMMIWGDMLQPVTKYNTSDAIEKIPKDILLLDFIWYFHMDKDIEENLLSHGFDVLFGNMYSSHFPRFEKRIRTQGVRGGQLSTWVEAKCDVLAREGKLYDFIYGAQMLWSETYTSYCRYSYDKLIAGMIPSMREKLEARKFPSLAKGHQESVLYQNTSSDFVSAEPGEVLSFEHSFDSLIFECAAANFMRRIPWKENVSIGSFHLIYEDDSFELVPMVYGNNLSHWNRRQNEPFVAGYYRHNGYSGTWFSDEKRISLSGKEGTVYRYEWINPKPDLKIKAIVFEPAGEIGVYIHQISGINL